MPFVHETSDIKYGFPRKYVFLLYRNKINRKKKQKITIKIAPNWRFFQLKCCWNLLDVPEMNLPFLTEAKSIKKLFAPVELELSIYFYQQIYSTNGIPLMRTGKYGKKGKFLLSAKEICLCRFGESEWCDAVWLLIHAYIWIHNNSFQQHVQTRSLHNGWMVGWSWGEVWWGGTVKIFCIIIGLNGNR